jgi:hypothetical protein
MATNRSFIAAYGQVTVGEDGVLNINLLWTDAI